MAELDLKEIVDHYNIAELLDKDELYQIGSRVVQDYKTDLGSRTDWEDRYEKYLKLASQAVETKTNPWPGAANIKYPLLTTAGLQFHARAYPALVPATQVVAGKVLGADEDGEKANKALRISRHMTYQIKEEMVSWEEEHDRMLLTIAFTGCEFKKSYYDPDLGVNQSMHVSGKDLVIDYWAKSLEKASRKTEKLHYSHNEITEFIRSGVYSNIDISDEASTSPDKLRQAQDDVRGMSAPQMDSDTPHLVLEYHGFWDMDGDGYKEPYIITVHEKTQQVMRITARYQEEGIAYNKDDKVQRIEPDEYYTQYNFIPDPNGSIYGIGFGILLSPINETVNTLINQLLDAGTINNLPSGFISRSWRVKGGNIRLKPGEYKTINATPEDIQKGLFPLPTNAPSSVLIDLFKYMVDAGERMSSTTDIMVGENPGQNQKATTSDIVHKEGQRVFTAIYKRLRRSMDKEFKKLFKLNSVYMSDEVVTRFNDEETSLPMAITRQDYDAAELTVIPSADPSIATEREKMQKAQVVWDMAQTGGMNVYEAKKRILEASEIPNIAKVLPDPKGPDAIQEAPPIDSIKEENAEKERTFRRAFDAQVHEDKMELEEGKMGLESTKVRSDIIKKSGDLELGDKKIEADKAKRADGRGSK